MSGLGETTYPQFGPTNSGSSGGSNWWQNLLGIGAQTGSQIALAQWGNAPQYQTTSTPYGSSTTVYGYAPGVPNSNVPQSGVYGGGGAAVGSSSTVLLIGGLLVLVMMMGKN